MRAAPGRPRRLPLGGGVGPVLAALGLVLVTAVSLALLFGRFDLLRVTPRGNGGEVPRTPNPSLVFTPSPSPGKTVEPLPGTILFVKNGDIWALDAGGAHRLLAHGAGGVLAMPAWSPDGLTIYYLEYRSKNATGPTYEGSSAYQLVYPVIMRMGPDGSGATLVQDALLSLGGGRFFFTWYLQPAVSPDGKTFALVTDAPSPFQRDVLLALLPTAGGKAQVLNVSEDPPLGHNDPAWSPDGSRVAFTYNASSGGVGAPRIALYTLATKKMTFLSGPGYAQPSWSPDGRWLAAVRTGGKTRDLVILSAGDGSEVARLTNDGRSFAPTWGADGRSIVYLAAQGGGIDLHLVQLGPGNPFSVIEMRGLTEASLLDGTSRPAWFIPPDERSTVVPVGTPRPTASPIASPAASGAPGSP